MVVTAQKNKISFHCFWRWISAKEEKKIVPKKLVLMYFPLVYDSIVFTFSQSCYCKWFCTLIITAMFFFSIKHWKQMMILNPNKRILCDTTVIKTFKTWYFIYHTNKLQKQHICLIVAQNYNMNDNQNILMLQFVSFQLFLWPIYKKSQTASIILIIC